MLDLISEEGLRILRYLEAMERQGAGVTVAQLDQFADVARPQWVPAYWDGYDDDVMRTTNWSKYLHSVEWIGVAGVDVETAQDDEVRGRALVRLTQLGRAVLKSSANAESSAPAQVLLGEKDPMAYGVVMANLAGLGRGLLVDPYLTDGVLLDLLKVTSVDRILTSAKGSKGRERAAALVALGQTNGLRTITVRVHDKLHDRFFLSDEGDLVALGASLNGVEKNLTTLVQLSGEAAQVLRQHFNAVWNEDLDQVLRPHDGDAAP